MPISARLMGPAAVAGPHLHVLYRDEEVADPHVLELVLTYRGRKDIRNVSFEQGQPLSLDVGVPIIDLLEKVFDPEEGPFPAVEAVKTALKIGPSFIRKGQVMTFVVLTDGPGGRLTLDSPLPEVKVRRETRYRARQDVHEARYQAGQGWLKMIITWVLVVFIVYYLAVNPQGAADFVHGVFSRLRGAGASLATFVNSL